MNNKYQYWGGVQSLISTPFNLQLFAYKEVQNPYIFKVSRKQYHARADINQIKYVNFCNGHPDQSTYYDYIAGPVTPELRLIKIWPVDTMRLLPIVDSGLDVVFYDISNEPSLDSDRSIKIQIPLDQINEYGSIFISNINISLYDCYIYVFFLGDQESDVNSSIGDYLGKIQTTKIDSYGMFELSYLRDMMNDLGDLDQYYFRLYLVCENP